MIGHNTLIALTIRETPTSQEKGQDEDATRGCSPRALFLERGTYGGFLLSNIFATLPEAIKQLRQIEGKAARAHDPLLDLGTNHYTILMPIFNHLTIPFRLWNLLHLAGGSTHTVRFVASIVSFGKERNKKFRLIIMTEDLLTKLTEREENEISFQGYSLQLMDGQGRPMSAFNHCLLTCIKRMRDEYQAILVDEKEGAKSFSTTSRYFLRYKVHFPQT